MASIALHEIGHLVPGKRFDVKTTQYFVGFGRTLWSRQRGETEYGFKLFPLGGYVRFVGMFPPAKDQPGKVRQYSTGPFRALADNARAAEWQDIRREDEGRLFYQKKSWQKLIIMASGPTMNILLAFMIFLGVAMTYGVYRSQPVVNRVQECIVATNDADRSCSGKPPTPAAQAGIRKGDRIVGFNSQAVTDWNEISTLIRANLDQPVVITVERDGQRVVLPLVGSRTGGVVPVIPGLLEPTVRAGAEPPSRSATAPARRHGPRGILGAAWPSASSSSAWATSAAPRPRRASCAGCCASRGSRTWSRSTAREPATGTPATRPTGARPRRRRRAACGWRARRGRSPRPTSRTST